MDDEFGDVDLSTEHQEAVDDDSSSNDANAVRKIETSWPMSSGKSPRNKVCEMGAIASTVRLSIRQLLSLR